MKLKHQRAIALALAATPALYFWKVTLFIIAVGFVFFGGWGIVRFVWTTLEDWVHEVWKARQMKKGIQQRDWYP